MNSCFLQSVTAAALCCLLPFAACAQQAAEADKMPPQVACTMDAKMCPDGSAVGRTGPDCAFALCPGETPPQEKPPAENPEDKNVEEGSEGSGVNPARP